MFSEAWCPVLQASIVTPLTFQLLVQGKNNGADRIAELTDGIS